MPIADMTDQQIELAVHAAASAGDAARLAVLEDECDRRDRFTPQPPQVVASLLQSALWYASQGLAVFPLQPGTKTPMPGSHGCKDATIDPGQISAWWRARPDANIGIATGLVCDVADLDGWAGVDAWAALEGVPEQLGVVVTPRTEGGGRHIYVPVTGQGNRARMLPGVDWRGQGGYVVAPPSVLPEGRYWWLRPLRMPADAA